MAYAQLVFPSKPQAGQVMKAIAKVLTGEKNTSNIEGLSPTTVFDTNGYGLGSYKTEIVNPSTETWQMIYPASMPANGDFNLTTFCLRSACVVNTKTKFVRFILTPAADTFTEPGGTAGNGTLTDNYNIHAQGVSSIDALGNVVNPSYRVNNGTFANIRKGTSASEPYVVWLSWSNRHLFILSSVNNGDGRGRNCYYGAFEFTENNLSTARSLVPCVHLKGSGVGAALSNLTTAGTTIGNCANILNYYDTSTFTTVSNRAIFSTRNSTANLNTETVTGLPWNDNIDIPNYFYYETQGAQLIRKSETAPIILNDVANGNGYINLSELSDIWIFYNAGFENMQWTNGTKIYKSLNIYANSGNSFSTILVKYG